MVTGKPPFRAQNHIELLRKIERGDGWVRFPDEAADQYRSGLNQPRQFRKSSGSTQAGFGNVSSAPTTSNNAFRVGSLGVTSSPGVLKSPVPEDIKDLVRKLLKRNPVERMGFEEFFIHSCVVEARQMDTRILESSSQIVASVVGGSTSSASSGYKSPVGSVNIHSRVEKLNFGPTNVLSNKSVQHLSSDSLLAPFPNYGHDPNWSQKVLEQTGPAASPQLSLRPSSEVVFQVKPPTLPKELKESFEESSIGSLGSIEFSSDEDKGDQKGEADANPENQQNTPPLPQLDEKESAKTNNTGLGASDDFVVVEKGQEVHVNWNPVGSPERPNTLSNAENISIQPRSSIPSSQSHHSTVSVPNSQTTWSRPFNPLHTISKALPSSLIYGSSPLSTGSPDTATKFVNPPKGTLNLNISSSFRILESR